MNGKWSTLPSWTTVWRTSGSPIFFAIYFLDTNVCVSPIYFLKVMGSGTLFWRCFHSKSVGRILFPKHTMVLIIILAAPLRVVDTEWKTWVVYQPLYHDTSPQNSAIPYDSHVYGLYMMGWQFLFWILGWLSCFWWCLSIHSVVGGWVAWKLTGLEEQIDSHF